MITELYIKDFAIIDELRLRLGPGFTVLSGETGAGKSIILDAVALLLGSRADSTVVRAGCQAAYIEGVFSLPPRFQETVSPLLAREEVEGGDPSSLLLAREVRLNGRNVCRVNGRAVTLGFMREVSEELVGIHGQGDHLTLLKPRAHLPLLDGYADLGAEREAITEVVRRHRQVQAELDHLTKNARQIAQRIDMLQFQVAEIDAANLEVGEEEELRAERTRLANVEQLLESTNEAMLLLQGVDDEMPAVGDMLSQAERALGQLARLDGTKSIWREKVKELQAEVEALTDDLRDYQESLEYNPGRLVFVEERLTLITSLKRKYGDTIDQVLSWRDRAQKELEEIGHSDERIESLTAEAEQLLRQIGRMAEALSEKRQEAARRLAEAVELELAELNMPGARFAVDVSRVPDESGAYVGEERLAFDPTGIDKVEFLISTNPGEPLKPMARVASGGETARLMLALKTVLARVDDTPTLIFDEIDQGIGGRVGNIVGNKLWGLATHGDHQVVVVTHLPQLAGYGDTHFHVSKGFSEGRTTTAVERLDAPGRLAELAAMLGTRDKAARQGARSILEQAERAKNINQPVL